jgi:hypothetical protein
LIPQEEEMFTGRDEQVRYEQNKDAYRQADAHRLAKQLPQAGKRFVFLSDTLTWLHSKIFRFQRPLDVENQALEVDQEATRPNVLFVQAEPLSAQE